MIDDFLPAQLAENLIARFGSKAAADDCLNATYDHAQQRFKSSYRPDKLDDFARTVFYAFNARPFIKGVENITGINGLIPDPYY